MSSKLSNILTKKETLVFYGGSFFPYHDGHEVFSIKVDTKKINFVTRIYNGVRYAVEDLQNFKIDDEIKKARAKIKELKRCI